MKKINFSKDVLPHAIAIGVFLIVTLFFFNPIFFDNKVLDQSDITQWEGSSKSMRDFRDADGGRTAVDTFHVQRHAGLPGKC